MFASPELRFGSLIPTGGKERGTVFALQVSNMCVSLALRTLLAICLIASVTGTMAQEKPGANTKYDVKRCTPRIMSHKQPSKAKVAGCS
jgi:hypothetical protein